jgi:3-hydroxybutyryl-CoA dehydrogenase
MAEMVAEADFVVEAVFEDLALKRSVFADLDRLSPERTILSSNTSSFMSSQLASATGRPDKVVVANWWNPPYLLPLVEVVRGPDTSDDTIETTRALLTKAGKRPVVLQKESLGFIGNRMQFALLREAVSIVERGIASPEDVDAVVTNSFGRRLAVAGPLEVFDLAG